MKGTRSLSETRIVRELAEVLSRRLINACIRDLQRIGGNALLSGDCSGLRNVWDEICVQEQRERSFSWHAYLETIDTFIDYRMDSLQTFELDSLWLLTPEGEDWECEDEDCRETYPVARYHVQDYLRGEVLTQANDWRNDRIARYLERGYKRD